MLLAVDIGNTSIVLGVYKGDALVNHWRVSTAIDRTVDEYATLLNSLLESEKMRLNDIDSTIISCVVPPLLIPFEAVCSKCIGVKPLIVEPGIKTGMPILNENPQEVGADRIVNAVAAYQKHKRALIIIDFGTATIFDYVTPAGEYVGGAMAPGIEISMEALSERASKLPRVELVKPENIIGENTIKAMQSGIFYGYVSLVDGIVSRMKESVKTDPFVIATGDLADLISRECTSIDEVDEMLTLEGLKILYEKNKGHHAFK